MKVYLLATLSFPGMLPKLKSIAEWELLGGPGAVLLSGLFVYDIFWVFGTPVMVTVAKSLDAPIKLLFPRAGEPRAHQPSEDELSTKAISYRGWLFGGVCLAEFVWRSSFGGGCQ